MAHTPARTGWTSGRATDLDNLTVILIGAIIAIHAVLGYVGSDQYWSYADVQETTLHPVTEIVLAVLVVPFGLFMIALLFLAFRGDLTGLRFGGPTWPAPAFAVVESALMVFGSLWLLGAAQRHPARPVRGSEVLGRSAYGAFLLQGFVLIGLAVALRPLGVPAEVMAIPVAAGGVAGSFALAWLLVSRVPWLARII